METRYGRRGRRQNGHSKQRDGRGKIPAAWTVPPPGTNCLAAKGVRPAVMGLQDAAADPVGLQDAGADIETVFSRTQAAGLQETGRTGL